MTLDTSLYFMISYPNIKPEIFSIGPITVRWYGLMYVVGYVLGYLMVRNRAQRGLLRVNYKACESFITYMIVGMLVGARVIYALVYNWDYYSENLLHVFRIWEGGLSFHGAAIGMIVASALFARAHKIPFYMVTDMLAIGATPGLFFGRMGNFFNAELYGRPTDFPLAMIFPTDPEKLPRHPSQLYQGLTEGILLFLFLWGLEKYTIKIGKYRTGLVGASFLIGYGVLRFITEFAREPDKQLGFVLGPLSMGQILCAIMVVAGIGVLIHVLRTEKYFIPKPQTQKELLN